MARTCLECGRKEGWFAYNYAGVNLRKAVDHPYPDRIEEIILAGDSGKDFLCADCANKRKVTCSVHGAVGRKLSTGLIPLCTVCMREWEEEGPKLPVQYMRMSETAKSGDAKALAWIAACHLLHAERVNIHRTVEHALGGAGGSSYTTWEASKAKALEFGRRAMEVCHEEIGRTFCRSLVARAESIQSSGAALRESTGVSSAMGPMAHYEYLPEELAILGGHQTLGNLSHLVSEVPCCEWLVGFGGISKVGHGTCARRTPTSSAAAVGNTSAHVGGTQPAPAAPAPRQRRTVVCPRCKGAIYADTLMDGENTCPHCSQKLKVSRRK